jgi:hypothetical protein
MFPIHIGKTQRKLLSIVRYTFPTLLIFLLPTATQDWPCAESVSRPLPPPPPPHIYDGDRTGRWEEEEEKCLLKVEGVFTHSGELDADFLQFYLLSAADRRRRRRHAAILPLGGGGRRFLQADNIFIPFHWNSSSRAA